MDLCPLCSAALSKTWRVFPVGRMVCGALSSGPLSGRPRPSFVSERDLNALVLRAAEDCFLMVVGCDRGRLIYVSASVTRLLNYDQVSCDAGRQRR